MEKAKYLWFPMAEAERCLKLWPCCSAVFRFVETARIANSHGLGRVAMQFCGASARDSASPTVRCASVLNRIDHLVRLIRSLVEFSIMLLSCMISLLENTISMFINHPNPHE